MLYAAYRPTVYRTGPKSTFFIIKTQKNFLSWKLDNPHYRLVKSQKVFMQRFLHFLRFAHQHLADIGDQLACIKIPSVVEFEAAEMI